MKESENLIRFDWAIKRLLRNKADYCVVEGLLTVLLDKPIKIKSLLESESNQEDDYDKFNRVDLLAEDEQGELMIFEIQNNRELSYFHRMTYGTSKVISEYLSKGDGYEKLRKVYSINIVYFSLGQGDDYAYRGKTQFVSMHDPNDILKLSPAQKKAFNCETPSDIFPEYFILRVDKFDEVAKTPLDEWISFLKNSTIPDGATAPGLKEAKELLRIDNLSEAEKRRYYKILDNLRYQKSVIETGRFEGHLEGLEEGRLEGLEVGRMEGLEEGRLEGLEEGRMEGRMEGRKQGLEEGRLEGRKQGREQGLEEGRLEGQKQGLEEGRLEGRKQGREQGLEEGRLEGQKQGREQGLEEGRLEGLEEGRMEGRLEGQKQGREQGLEEGRAKGIESQNIEHVKRLRSKGFDNQEIADMLGLEISFVNNH